MTAMRVAVCVCLFATLGCVVNANVNDDESKEVDEAIAIANAADKPTQEAQVAADAKNADRAATMAKEAANVANKVATHSIEMTSHAKSALKNAHDALHKARVQSQGLTESQKENLKIAEKKLKEATKDAELGAVKEGKYTKAAAPEKEKKLEKMKKQIVEIKVKKDDTELKEMRKQLEELRKKLAEDDDADEQAAIKELEKQIADMIAAEKKEDKVDAKSHDEMKAEIERLREQIEKLEAAKKAEPKAEPKKIKVKAGKKAPEEEKPEPATVESRGLDIDTAMPYGDLEPFGREDTAQELTEDSINQSDEMVDQLERAEVAEEKRAVFRALTRLRGAAITSYDGVARSQTGNIDEYNKVHQWRAAHPIHHLADEESDVNRWAFPDNAD